MRMPMNYKYDSEMVEVIQRNMFDVYWNGDYPGYDQQIDFSKQKLLYPYGHPGLRTISDYCFLKALVNA
jgi:hypothetical protein